MTYGLDNPDETAPSAPLWPSWSRFEQAVARFRWSRHAVSYEVGFCAAIQDQFGDVWNDAHPEHMRSLRRLECARRIYDRDAQDLAAAFEVEPPWGCA